MQSTTTSLVVIGVLGGFLTTATWAQPGPRGVGPSRLLYNPKTVETIVGEVISVDKVSGPGRGYGLHLTLKTAQETIAVHLAPGWYLDKQGFTIAAKDVIEVKGSRITFKGKPAIIAAQIMKGDRVLQLRDERGIPSWRGRGRRGPRS